MTNDKYLGRLLKKIDGLKGDADLALEVALKKGNVDDAAQLRCRIAGIESAEDAVLKTVAEYLIDMSDDDQ